MDGHMQSDEASSVANHEVIVKRVQFHTKRINNISYFNT
jgi:hypothetical protein